MTHVTETSAIANRPSRIAAFFDTVGLKVRQRRAYRQTYNELCSMTARDLSDLGMCRGDFNRIAGEAAAATK